MLPLWWAPFRCVSYFLVHVRSRDDFLGVLHLPAWFPGMSFKRHSGMARVISKQCLERPFECSLQREVMVVSITHMARMLNSCTC